MTVTAKVQKKKGGKIGLKLTSEGGKLFVTKIAEGGPIYLAKTPLEVGMEVIAINGKSVVGLSSADAAQKMLDTDGTLEIEAQHPQSAFVCGTFYKETATTKVGLRLEDGEEKVLINSIREGTLAATTRLGPKMAIRLVNNINCVGKDAMFVAQLLADAVGTLTVVAETSEVGELADRELISAVVVKEEGAKLGLTLTEVDDKLVITKIREEGLVAGTDLKAGMEIYSINNISVFGKTSSDAAGILIEAKGTITILAFKGDIDGDDDGHKMAAGTVAGAEAAAAGREIITVVVDKKPGAKLGLTLSEVDDKLMVTKVKEGGLVAATALTAGMEIFSINDILVAGKSSTEAAGILVEASGTLTIVAFKGEIDGDDGGDQTLAKAALGAAAVAGTAAAVASAGSPSDAAAAAAAGREIVTVTVVKKAGSKLGLTLSEVDDKLMVTKVKEGGLVAGTELTAGMEIFSINGIDVSGKTSSEAAGILVDAVGTITIIAFKEAAQEEVAVVNKAAVAAAAATAATVATAAAVASSAAGNDSDEMAAAAAAASAGREVVTVTVEKQEGVKLGLTLSEVENKLMVTKVKEDGLVAGTKLTAGMEIFSINNTVVAGKSSAEAAGLLVGAKGTITIIAFKEEAEDENKSSNLAKAAVGAAAVAGTAAALASSNSSGSPSSSGGAAVATAAAGREIVTVTVVKQAGSKLGLTLSEVQKKLVVTKVKEGGLVAGTELTAGMEIYSINDIVVAGKSSAEAAGILVDARGTITIIAFKEDIDGDKPLAKAALGAAAVGAAVGTAAALASDRTPSDAVVDAAAGRAIVTVIVEKQAGAKLGLTLSAIDKKVMVTKVKEEGLVAGTELVTGMEIFSINGTEVAGKSSAEAAGILVAATGTLTIVAFGEVPMSNNLAKAAIGAAAVGATAGTAAALVNSAANGDDDLGESAAGREVVTVTVEKEEGAKLGLTLSEVDDKLLITNVKPGGLMADTALAAGMEIYTINDIKVAGKSSSEAAGILVEAKGSITIVAFKGEIEKSSNNLAKAAIAAAVVGTAAGTAAALAPKGGGGESSVAASPETGYDAAEVSGKNAASLAAVTAAGLATGAALASIPRSASMTSTMVPGTFTMAVINKEPGQKLGFRLGLMNNVVIVSGIGEGSLASQTGIQPGMTLVLINNKGCAGKDTSEIAKMLAQAGDLIVIVAETPGPAQTPRSLVSAVVNKEKDAKVGVTLTKQGGRLVITKIKEDGLFANTDLRVGMDVLLIDNESCVGKSSLEAAQLFQRAAGTLMILAQKPALSAGALITAALARDSPESKLGIRLGTTNGVVVVTNISEGSLAYMTDLTPGMTVRTINNVDVSGMDSTGAANLFRDAEGIITILAETQTPNSAASADVKSLVAVSVRNISGAHLGLSLSQVKEKLIVSKIEESGLFFGTSLRIGMQVLKINNVDSAILTQEASELLMQKEGILTVLAKRGEIKEGSLMTAVMYKEAQDTKVGLGLGLSNGMIVVTKIRDGTLGSMTDLRPGMVVRTVNNVSCEGKDSMGVAKLLSEAVGMVTVVAEAVQGSGVATKVPKYFTATIDKEPGSKVGLALTKTGGALVVTRIAEGGLIYGSGIEVGMEVLAINNIDASNKTGPEAAEILQQAEGRITILAKKPGLAPGSLVTASITKESANAKVGLKLGKANDAVIVTGIGEDSLIAVTDLEPGMVVKTINNTDCTGLDVQQAAKLLIEAEGILTILAEVPKGRVGGAGASVIASLVTATAQNEKEIPIGVKLERTNGKILISEITKDGALFGTGLRVGMEVVSINNVDAGVLTMASANELLQKEGTVTLLAKTVSLPPGTLLTAAFTKESQDMKVGLGLGTSNGVIVITKVNDGTLAATTNLGPGMVVRSINNIDCTKRSSEMAAKILREAVGTVTILAEKPTGSGIDLTLPVSSLFAITFRKEKDDKIGVTLNNDAGKLNVGGISETSVLANTRLRVGMEVIKINNIDTSAMSPTEAAELLTISEGSITILAKKPSLPKGTIITAVVTKENIDTKVGIGLGTLKEAIVITNIKDDGLAAASDLEVGMVVRTINNVDCVEITADEAAQLLKESEGRVTIVAESARSIEPSYDSLLTATVEKDKEEKVGLTVASKGNKVFISKIKSDGLLAGSGLAVGMELLSVNNVVCAGKPSSETAKLLAETQGTLTLLARKAALLPGSFVTALITKESAETKVGLRLGLAGGLLVVSSIAEDSLASMTDLRKGMILKTINNVDCTGMAPTEAAKLLMEAEGTVTVLAEVPSPLGVAADAPVLSSFVTASFHSAAGSDLGLSLVREEGTLLVSEIQQDGVVVGSALRVGMEVVKINNIDCGVLTADAAAVLLTSEETLTILARKAVLAPGSLVTAVLKKDSQDTRVGLKMGQSQGMIVVTGVNDGSLASTTPLESGMVIRSINNINFSKKNSMDAAKLLGGAVGLITILAEVPNKATVSAVVPSLVTATIDKDGEMENGVTFAEDEEGKLTVASVSKDGKWAKTRLRVGMSVKMINTFACDGRSPSELDVIIENTQGKVTILAQVEALPPGSLVTAAMTKESPDEKVGLGLGVIGGLVYITSIKNDTLASPTDLRTGMQLMLVNNIDCSELSAGEVGKLLAEAKDLTLVAAIPKRHGQDGPGDRTPVTATVLKEQDAIVGLSVTEKGGKVYISKIYQDGLLTGTALRVGMEILSINNHPCAGKTAPECARLLKDVEGTLTVLACNQVLPPGSFVTAVITKDSEGSKVGLRLGDDGGRIIITSIAEGSLALATELKTGMSIRAINNVDCTGLSTMDAAKLLIAAEGTVTILAATPEKSKQSTAESPLAGICAVSVHKTSDTELGMKVVRRGGSIIVSEILGEGLIFGSPLRVGMQILKVNNSDCTMLSASSALALMETEGMVTILARRMELPPGFLVTAVIVKESQDVKVGLGMGLKNGLIYVTKIRDGTLTARTELQPGLIVRTINNIDLTGMSLVDAANLLANAEGTITLAAEMPGQDSSKKAAMLFVASTKTVKDERVGIALAEKDGELFVSQISKAGPFAGTALQVGMKVLSVNNISCQGMSVQNAASLMIGMDGDLALLAEKLEELPGSLVTASITKDSAGSKIGIRLAAATGGLIVVKAVAPDSLAAQAELKPGMIVKSIDNVSVQGKDPVSAARLLAEAEGTLTIVAEIPGQTLGPAASTLVTATVKVDESSKLGLAVSKKNGNTIVARIDINGLFYGSGLRVGMEVLKINNVDCKVLTTNSAHVLMGNEGMLTILARKTLKRAGILVAASFKKPTEAKAGLGLGTSKGHVIITKTSDGKAASTAEIQPGMAIRQVNGIACGEMNCEDVAKMIAASEGIVTMLLETPGAGGNMGSESLIKSLVTASVDMDKEGDLGLSLMINNGSLVVAKVSGDGRFAESGLRPGMVLLSINNTNCARRSPEEAMGIIGETLGLLTLLAQKPFLGPGEIVTATMVRNDQSEKLGVGLGTSRSGRVVVTSIKPGTLSYFTELYPGMAVKSINNQSLSTQSPADVAELLSKAVGVVTVAAESMLDFNPELLKKKTQTKPATITATVTKEKGGKVGVLLGEKGSKLFISKIVPGGLVSETCLKVGMQVLSVNNVDCTNLKVTEAAEILLEAEGLVTILARQPEYSPGALITVLVPRDTPDSPIGIGLGVLNRKVVISSIKYGALAADTELQVGMAVKAVNNVDCSRMGAKAVAKLFSEASGNILILAEVPYPPSRTVGGDSTKPGRRIFDNEARPPPYGLNEGGVWVRRKYAGETTNMYTAIGCACLIVPGIYSLLNPVDERDVYILDGKAYTGDGECIGSAALVG